MNYYYHGIKTTQAPLSCTMLLYVLCFNQGHQSGRGRTPPPKFAEDKLGRLDPP